MSGIPCPKHPTLHTLPCPYRPETHEVQEARLQVSVSPEVLADEAMLAAVKAVHEERLAAMFRLTVSEPMWSEPEPHWLIEAHGCGDDLLMPRRLAGDAADGPPSLYFFTVSQRGVPS